MRRKLNLILIQVIVSQAILAQSLSVDEVISAQKNTISLYTTSIRITPLPLIRPLSI